MNITQNKVYSRVNIIYALATIKLANNVIKAVTTENISRVCHQ